MERPSEARPFSHTPSHPTSKNARFLCLPTTDPSHVPHLNPLPPSPQLQIMFKQALTVGHLVAPDTDHSAVADGLAEAQFGQGKVSE